MTHHHTATHHTTTRRTTPNASEAGIALVAALSMLVLFALLGSAYVGYMTGEFDRTRYEVRTVHARQLAEAGIQAATGELQQILARGEVPGDAFRFQIPVYDQQRTATHHEVSVTLSDEAARINLNLAPREVLESLGLDRSQIRDLKRDLPRGDVVEDPGRRWLVNPADLQHRGYVGAAAFAELDRSLLTTYSADPLNSEGYINLNSASPAVLAAVLNVSPEDANAIAEKRPFTSWEDALTKIGRQPETFNISPGVDEIGEMPGALALNSRCYRLKSEVALAVGGGKRRIRHSVEAVVDLGADGKVTTRYWHSESGLVEDAESEPMDDEDTAEVAPEVTDENELSDSPAEQADSSSN